MTADDSARIGSLETAVAKLEQRVDDLRGDVKELTPLSLAVAKMEGTVDRMQIDLRDGLGSLATRINDIATLVTEDREKRETREREEADRRESERKDSRKSRFYLVIGCLTAVLAPAGTIVAAVIG